MTQITAASHSQVCPKNSHSAWRNLDDGLPILNREHVGKPRRFRDAIKVMANRKYAGVVDEPLLGKYVQRPERILSNRKRGSPEPDNLCAASVLNCGFGLAKVG